MAAFPPRLDPNDVRALARRLARDEGEPAMKVGGLGSHGYARLMEFLKGRIPDEDFPKLSKLLDAISRDTPTAEPDDPHRANKNWNKPQNASDAEPVDYSFAPAFLREAGMSQADIAEFVAKAKEKGGIFLPRAGGNQAQDSRLQAANAADFNRRFPGAAHIRPDDKLGVQALARAPRGSAEDFNRRFPSAKRIGQVIG